MKLILTAIILLFWTTVVICQTTTIYVPSVGPSNSATKTGYNLIFEEKFDGQTSLDLTKWNRSTPTDDGDNTCPRNIAMNPNNISVSTGVCKLEINNTNSSNGCEYSSSEIKSFSVTDPAFKNYYFKENSFIEARVKIPIKYGIGSAGWLYNCYPFYSEIDMWETDGRNTDRFWATYHWQDGAALACSSGQSNVRKSDGCEIKVKKTGTSQDLDLTSDWMTFAVKWQFDSVVWYLNNVKARAINLFDTKRPTDCCTEIPLLHNCDVSYGHTAYPLSIRFGSGPNSVGNTNDLLNSSDLPQSLQVDYIRIWKKVGYKAIFFNALPAAVCKTGGTVVQASYYPGVSYSWDQTNFDVAATSNSANYPWEIWVTPHSNLTNSTIYSLILTATFPSGYIEKDTVNLFIHGAAPTNPTTSVTSSRIGTSCYYEAKLALPDAYTTVLWNEDNLCSNLVAGYNAKIGSTWYSKYGTFDQQGSYTVKIKTQNSCGITSSCATKTFTTGTPPGNCQLRLGDSTVSENQSVTDEDLFFISELSNQDFIFYSTQPVTSNHAQLTLRIYDLLGRELKNIEVQTGQKVNFSLIGVGSEFLIACLFNEQGVCIDKLKFIKTY